MNGKITEEILLKALATQKVKKLETLKDSTLDIMFVVEETPEGKPTIDIEVTAENVHFSKKASNLKTVRLSKTSPEFVSKLITPTKRNISAIHYGYSYSYFEEALLAPELIKNLLELNVNFRVYTELRVKDPLSYYYEK